METLQPGLLPSEHKHDETVFIPYWARSTVQYAQSLLEYSPEPIEYIFDEDSWDNCFFFPEDCTRAPPAYLATAYETDTDAHTISVSDVDSCSEDMTPALPDIRMLDSEALGDLLEDNLSPPEITSIFHGMRADLGRIFATNGAIFAYASDLPIRRLRSLSATYGAAYTSFAKTSASGNLTGVNPASHPSSFVTAPSLSLGDVGSIVFEQDNRVAIVTKIGDKVALAVVGPSKLEDPETVDTVASSIASGTEDPTEAVEPTEAAEAGPTESSAASKQSRAVESEGDTDKLLAAQYEIDRSNDLARLAGLNLNASPEILLALESKSAALGRFLGQKLKDLHSPEDF